jgi:general secretion pathway protein J
MKPYIFRRQKNSGFTLIEILVAITIFAIMSAFAYRALTSVLEARKQLEVEQHKWRDVVLMFARMEQDFSSALKRPIRDTGGNTAPAFDGKPDPVGETDGQVVFTRMGYAGQRGALAAPQRMGYRFRDNKLEQLTWQVLDQAPRTVPLVGTLIENASEVKFQFLENTQAPTNVNAKWLPRWPQPGTPPKDADLPAAVEVSLTLMSGENLKRIFLLPSDK